MNRNRVWWIGGGVIAVIILCGACLVIGFVGFLLLETSPTQSLNITHLEDISVPSPTPVPTANQLIELLQGAGLEVADVQPAGDLPPGAVEGLKFYTPSLCDGCSSMVFIFDSEGNALQTKAMIQQAGQANDALKFYVYQKGRVLLRIGGLVDETQADRYGDALGLNQ